MKKALLPLLLAAALLLSGCGRRENETRFERFAEALRAREDLSLRAAVRAEYDDRTLNFTLSYRDEPGGGCLVEVIEPEIIRGVKARMNGSGTKLLYDSVSIDTGDDGGTGLSPMGALPLFVRALRDGTPDSFWKEEGNCAVRLVPEDGIDVNVFFDAEMVPTYAEIAREGKTVLFIEISEFGYLTADEGE